MTRTTEERIVGALALLVGTVANIAVIFWAAGGVINLTQLWLYLLPLLCLLALYWRRSNVARYYILQALSLTVGSCLIAAPAFAIRLLTWVGVMSANASAPLGYGRVGGGWIAQVSLEIIALWIGAATFGLILSGIGAEAVKRAMAGRLLDFPSFARLLPEKPREEDAA